MTLSEYSHMSKIPLAIGRAGVSPATCAVAGDGCLICQSKFNYILGTFVSLCNTRGRSFAFKLPGIVIKTRSRRG